MKIAALALLRKGYQVRVETVGKEVWLVFLQVRVDTMVEQLAALWRPDGRRQGTIFHIIGYLGDAFADRFAVNIPRERILHQGPSPLTEPVQRYNQLIASPPGRIYARDIYMRDIQSPFSYNLWGFEMAPDRHGPRDEGHLWVDMGRVWATVDKADLLQRFLGMVRVPPLEAADEGRGIDMGDWAMGEDPVTKKTYFAVMAANQEAWRQAWRWSVGENVVLRTDAKWDASVKHLGYESASVGWNVQGAISHVIWRDIDLVRASQERLRDAQVIPDGPLTPLQRVHLALARAIASRYRWPPIAGVHAAIIPPASDRMRTAGLYNRRTEEILIGAEHLISGRATVDTVIHEIAHHVSGAEDGQEAHNAAMTVVAAQVVQWVAAGTFDEELKEVEW